MSRRSFKSKIILPAVGVVAVLTVVMTSYVSVRFLNYSDALINEKVAANTQLLRDFIRNSQQNSKAAAVSMAHAPEAIDAIKSRNREKILEIFTPTLELYQINFYTITDEKGIVLARTHDPENFGDSVLNQRNVQDALSGNVYTEFEAGTVIQVSVRTGAPVYDADGTLIGAISAGMRFDTNDEADSLKQHFQSDVAVFVRDTKISTTITDEQGERATGAQMDPDIAAVVITGKKEHYGDTDLFGVLHRTFYMPLIDTQGDVFAVVLVGIPMSELKSQAVALILNIVIISFIGLVVSSVILYWAISAVSKPLLELSQEMNRMEEGELDLAIDADSSDEIGLAGRSLQKVADILHKLMDDINVAISEHEKGNTEYRIDISGFHGAYYLLADRIVTLSSLGMVDQLTGLPNRRSFDNRLKIEWSRAMRDNSSLSILMLDVDKFKTYNDTYGHQQGDVVLQTVAKTLPLPIKRGFDFAARWGGEEFVVLLPNTDLAGAVQIAEAIRATVENTDIPNVDAGQAKKVTVSIGVCTFTPSPEHTIENFIARADEALYRAKETGRNRVCQYMPPKEPGM